MVDMSGWTNYEKAEYARIISEAEALESDAAKINKEADAKDMLRESEAALRAVKG